MEARSLVTRARPLEVIRVELAPSYPVVVGSDLLARAADWIDGRRLAIVTDETVAALHEPALRRALEGADRRVDTYVVPPGEDSKSPAQYADLLRAFARDGLDRDAAVVALGGGVVSDLAGFVAATFMRGIDFYVVPTTVLAMVDASVGGKTAVNLPEGKNLAGAFWQPRAVLADVATLRSLPEREFRLGAVEAFKHGLLADPSLLAISREPSFGPASDEAVLVDRVARSIRVKAEVVAADEREAGDRAHLNLGHTLAHGLEGVSDHALPHGDAVAYGLLFAAVLGRARGLGDWIAEARELLRWLGPRPFPDAEFDAVMPFMRRDKKHRSGRMRFVLLDRIGAPKVYDDVTEDELRSAWRAMHVELEGEP